MRRAIPLLLAAAAACAPSFRPISPTPTVVRAYTVGEVQTASVGEPFFQVATADQVPLFVALRDVEGRRGFLRERVPDIREGTVYRAETVRDSDGAYNLVPVEQPTSAAAWPAGVGLVISSAGVPLGWAGYGPKLLVDEDRLGQVPLFQRSDAVVEQEGAFRAELIYSGLDGRTLHAVYREYAGDFLRPAFTQNLQYSLDESSILAFRTVQVEVVNATNTALTYRIVEDGDLPWLPE
jgi:hypothetical protein